MVGPHTRAIAWLYEHALKPVLFTFDPEQVHDRFLNIGQLLGATSAGQALTNALFGYTHPALQVDIAGIHFPNPIGLAAGFDKNAKLANILHAVGFGFAELGSFTGRFCSGNPKPRLWRKPEEQSLIINYGLANEGAEAIASKLRGRRFAIPIGISAAKTNDTTTIETEAAIADYVHAIEQFHGIGDYLAINISCPNAFGGEPFNDPSRLDQLLAQIDTIADKPVFVKVSVGMAHEQLNDIVAVCDRHRVHGFICGNLLKGKDQRGSISGLPVQKLSDDQVAYLYRKTAGKYTIIGVGGIFTAEDAYRKIRLGASLVQLITSMIYRGPQLIGQLNHDLVRLLERDGFHSISQAVGIDIR